MRRRYGGSPLHLLVHLALVAVAAWCLAQMFGAHVAPRPVNLALWLLLGAVAHDLVLLPAYALADRGLRCLPRAVLNHVRVPLAISGVLLLVWFPLILGTRPSGYAAALGREPPDYLGRWLSVTAGLALLSAVLFAARRLRARGSGRRRAAGRGREARRPRAARSA
jgi:hypothetical protein